MRPSWKLFTPNSPFDRSNCCYSISQGFTPVSELHLHFDISYTRVKLCDNIVIHMAVFLLCG